MMTLDFSPYMQRALELAESAAQEDEVPVGAVIVYQDRIIGEGYNRRENHNNPIAHAEMEAIQSASRTLQSWRLIDCSLIVTLEPCPMCLAAAQQARIKEIIYGATDPKGGALSLGYFLNQDSRTNHRFPVTLVETPACGHILSKFFKKKRELR